MIFFTNIISKKLMENKCPTKYFKTNSLMFLPLWVDE